LPILNISEHLTRTKVQTGNPNPDILGVLLGTQNGREIEIVNTFELALEASSNGDLRVDHDFLATRRDQYKQVFPALDFIGWYTVAPIPTAKHISLHEQFVAYSSTPLLLVLQPSKIDTTAQSLPLKVYESTIEIRDRRSRSVFIEVPFSMETGEAERIAVDFTAKGAEGGTTLVSHLQTQRAAVKMLHDRIVLLTQYVTSVLAQKVPMDRTVLRALASLLATLPASESSEFRKEFDTEYTDVQITAYLSTLTKTTDVLNNLVDKHLVFTAGRGEERGPGPRKRGMGGRMGADWGDRL